MAETFSIGTSGTRISLINASGFYVKEGWRPRAAEIDDIWQESALADYKQLAAYRDLTVIESIPLALFASSQDNAATLTQSMRQMLRTARNYWVTTWEDDLVYLQLQGSSETNARYAIVHAGRMAEDETTFSCWMEETGAATMPDLMLIVERGPWLENAPGTGTAVELSALETYDSRNLGNVNSSGTRTPTTAEGAVFIANKRNTANLSDVYVDDGGAFGANLMDDADKSFDLLPAVPAANDAVYFGIDTSLSDSGPFCSLVFDIGTAQSGCTTVWEYYNGAWTDFDASVQDNTDANGAMTGNAFDTTGVHSVHWIQPSGWTTVAVNGVTGYWVRVRVTGVSSPTPPAQQNRNIYTVTWPYVEVQSTEIGGDLPALAQFQIRCQGDKSGGAPSLESGRLLVGLRSTARGTNFSAYLNASDEQNPTGVTCSAGGGSAFASDVQTPTGRKLTNAGVTANDPLVTWYLSSTYAYEWFGLYHAFVRIHQTSGSAGDIELRIRVLAAGTNTFTGAYMPIPTTTNWQAVDLGLVEIGSGAVSVDDELGMYLWIDGNGDNTKNIEIFDLILLPVDEWAGDFLDLEGNAYLADRGNAGAHGNTYLDVDSIQYPRYTLRSLLRKVSDDTTQQIWRPINNGPAIFQNGQTQRLWFFLADPNDLAKFEIASTVQSWENSRYESLRGAG